MRYTFGDSLSAAERLRRIAAFFDPLAADFIRKHHDAAVFRAADLGCGPGYSTAMLAEATGAPEVVGFDQSKSFLKDAGMRFPHLTFRRVDVCQLPNDEKFSVLYCRFLLSHLQNCEALLRKWLCHLVPGGRLYIDELESISTEVPVFKKYLEISDRLVSSQHADLYVGRKLPAYCQGLKVLSASSDVHPVSDSLAASWFLPNTVGAWKDSEFIRSAYGNQEIEALMGDLEAIYTESTTQSHITWTMKRIVLTN